MKPLKNIPGRILKKSWSFIKTILIEVMIIVSFMVVINNYIGKPENNINADGVGYYDYLPSIFIHHDFIRKNATTDKNPLLYKRVDNFGGYVPYGNFKVNKYTCGTALLQLPFFIAARQTATLERNFNDGFQMPFQRGVRVAALFYLFLSLFFLKKTLKLFDIKIWVIALMQLLLVFATGVSHYANYDAAFSHIYSLFAIMVFSYFVKSFFKSHSARDIILACMMLGLIIILRQINFIIILFIPFLAGSSAVFKAGMRSLFKKPAALAIGILSAAAVVFIQCLAWYAQTGSFILYSYQGEGFNFAHPEIINVLFSFQKGLFVYTPVLIISLFGLAWLAYKRLFYQLLSWLAFFLILTYVLASWHNWYYGSSFGLRAYIDFYAVFFILFAIFLNGIGTIMKVIIALISLITIPVNIIQTYQYKVFILHWYEMDYSKYKKVFLRTDTRFRGWLWKRSIADDAFQTLKEIRIDSADAPVNTEKLIYKLKSKEFPQFDKASILQIKADNGFDADNNAKVLVSINDTAIGKNYYWYDPYFISYCEKNTGEWQTGVFNYELPVINDTAEKTLEIKLCSKNQHDVLKNIRIKFLGPKP
ncbi:MAG: hypothetical protein WCM76_03910 [Bacteroidota bacterium]